MPSTLPTLSHIISWRPYEVGHFIIFMLHVLHRSSKKSPRSVSLHTLNHHALTPPVVFLRAVVLLRNTHTYAATDTCIQIHAQIGIIDWILEEVDT